MPRDSYVAASTSTHATVSGQQSRSKLGIFRVTHRPPSDSQSVRLSRAEPRLLVHLTERRERTQLPSRAGKPFDPEESGTHGAVRCGRPLSLHAPAVKSSLRQNLLSSRDPQELAHYYSDSLDNDNVIVIVFHVDTLNDHQDYYSKSKHN